MIEINLVPDVKQELLKAQRIRTTLISVSVVTSLIVGGLVVVLALYVLLVQTGRDFLANQAINSENTKLSNVADLSSVLTIQNQLSKLSEMHDSKHLTSRAFDVLVAVTPQGENKIATTHLTVDTDQKKITVEGQADNGYVALEAFKKTILATKVQYTQDGQEQAVALTDKVNQGDQSFGEDASGKKVLRFTISFTYADQLFAPTALSTNIIPPGRTNVTDSYVSVPASLFTTRASDLKESN